jgi:hypothetical protein
VKQLTTKHLAIRAAITIALLAASTRASGQGDPRYLAQLPSVERVRADVQGSDRLDALARQKAAFEQLFRLVGVAAGPRQFAGPGLTPTEERWRGLYRSAADAARKEAYAGLSNAKPGGLNPFAKSPLQQWNALTGEYERDADGRDELLRRYFSQDAYTALSTALSDDDRSREGGNDFAERYGAQAGPVGWLARAVYWLVVAIMILAVVREWLPFGVSRSDPLTLRAGFGRYRLQWVTGRVEDFFRRTETEGLPNPGPLRDMTGTETRGGPSPREHVRLMFSLVLDNGQRHAVHLVDSGVAVPEGHLVTAVWAARKGASSGTYVAFFDRTASQTQLPTQDFADMFRVAPVAYLPALAFSAIVGAGVTIATGDGTSQTLGVLMGLFLGAIAARVVFLIVLTRRARRFAKKDAPRILAAVNAQDPVAVTPGT